MYKATTYRRNTNPQERNFRRTYPTEQGRVKECVRCKQLGHTVKDCPRKERDRQERLSRIGCSICGHRDHAMPRCPEVECRTCKEKGHISRDCSGVRKQKENIEEITWDDAPMTSWAEETESTFYSATEIPIGQPTISLPYVISKEPCITDNWDLPAEESTPAKEPPKEKEDLRKRCICKIKNRRQGRFNNLCPFHNKECLCYNNAARYCGFHDHETTKDEYEVCRKCAEKPRICKEERHTVQHFAGGCHYDCTEESPYIPHSHTKCKVHKRYFSPFEEMSRRGCHKCADEYDQRGEVLRLRIVDILVNIKAYEFHQRRREDPMDWE